MRQYLRRAARKLTLYIHQNDLRLTNPELFTARQPVARSPLKWTGKKAELYELLIALDNLDIITENGTHVIERYDCPDAFHFVDPPYVGTDCGHYNGSFNDADFESLLRTLASVKGKFMLTMFPHPLIEKYATQNGWTIHRIERTITASKVSRRRQEEWIVTNYPDPRKAD